ncbi:MAG TPA: hypothetical protein VMB71_01360, partial [Acetobacteraceae bacterium]|nr:hypothetical protein [Acetobacteraceae bacterium]
MRTLHRTFQPALLAAVLAGFAAAAVPARAGTVEMSGGRLQLITTGDNGASIETDTGLNGAVRVVGDDLSCMQIHNGSSIEVNTAGCSDSLGHLTVMVPSGFPVDLTMRGSGDVHIGDLHGPLNATIDADGALTAGALNVLHLVMHGSGDATVAAANGATDIEDFGSGEVKLSDL